MTGFDSQVHKENDEQISYLKLIRHIQRNHPTDENDKFYTGKESIGNFRCCNKKVKDKDGNE